MSELVNDSDIKNSNKINFKRLSKLPKQKVTEPLVLSLNVVHIDDPKNGHQFYRRKVRNKVQLNIPKTMNIKRSYTSDLSKYEKQYRKKTNRTFNHVNQVQKQFQDQVLFSDKNFSSRDIKHLNIKLNSQNSDANKNINQNTLKDENNQQKIDVNEKQQQKLQQQENKDRKKQKQIQKEKIQVERYQYNQQVQISKIRKKNKSKNQRRSYFPQLKINSLTSHTYRRSVHAQFIQAEEKDELKGWALQGQDVDKRIDIIEYARKSLVEINNKSIYKQ